MKSCNALMAVMMLGGSPMMTAMAAQLAETPSSRLPVTPERGGADYHHADEQELNRRTQEVEHLKARRDSATGAERARLDRQIATQQSRIAELNEARRKHMDYIKGADQYRRTVAGPGRRAAGTPSLLPGPAPKGPFPAPK